MRLHRIGLVAVATLLLGALAWAQDGDAEHHFILGKQLIEDNGADTMGATRNGLEKGIVRIRKAIDLGYSDKAAAYKLLANAYNTLALVYAEPDSKEQNEVFLLQRQALEKLLELKPNDPRIRAEYARVVKDPQREIAALRDVIVSEPNDANARWSLGMILVHNGQAGEGFVQLKKCVELAGLYWGQIYAYGARDALIEKGRTAEAAEISRLIEKRKEPFYLPKQTLDRLRTLKPGDGRMRAELAKVVRDPKKQAGGLQDILSAAPNKTRTGFSLGMVLLYDREFATGVHYLKQTLESADPHWSQTYGRIAQNFLIEEGRTAEAAEIAALMAKKKLKRN